MTKTTCAACGRSAPPELQMQLKNGKTLTMASCPRCESRSWAADGQPVTMSEVLALTAGDPEFTLSPSSSKGRRGQP